MSLELFPELVCRRVFLGWDAPFLPAAVQRLSDEFSSNEQLHLGNLICVLPTTQSAIRFSQLLNSLAEASQLDFTAPLVITSGDLAETLYTPERPIAIEFEQSLAWARVLRQQPPESLRPLLPVLPDSDSLGPWLELSGTLRRLSSDLATHAVNFQDVLDVSETPAEQDRWRLLQGLDELYLTELQKAGLSDPHQQRRRAVKRKSVRSSRMIALIGTSDLNESISRIVAEVDQDIVAMIAAPEQQQDSFDWLGRFKTDAFANWELPLDDQQLIPAADIGDQAAAASELVAEFAKQFEPGKIAVGATDSSHVAPAEMQLEGCGFLTHRHEGWTVSSTSIGRLIQLTATFVSRPTWQSLAALVRHGDVHRFLQAQCEDPEKDLLISLDQLLANHLPVRLSDSLPAEATKRYAEAILLRERVGQLFLPFTSPRSGKAAKKSSAGQNPFSNSTFASTQTIASWCASILEWLDSLYPSSPDSESDQSSVDRSVSIEAISKVRDLLTRFSKLSDHLDVPVTVSAALETLFGRLNELRVVTEPQDNQVNIHGWLDLPLDDSPAMVVIGLNHPFVPSAVTSDPFLPGALRAKLRVADNDRRYARDVLAMQLLLSTRKDIRFIVGKNSADGSPTPPSRLLAAAPQEAIARRIRMLLDGQRSTQTLTHQWDGDLEISDLPIPKIVTTECPVKAMSVTAFKAYLECPYRFYLRHVLKLKPIDDSARELAANQFGDLVHGAVEHFGESDAKNETDETKIFEALRHELNKYAKANYGDHVQSAVRLQVRQAERRLRFVATEQAKRIAEGWVIHKTEDSVDEHQGDGVQVDGKRMGLRGRFDRIDFHPQDKRWAILDYKTHGHKPEKKHLKRNRETGDYDWIDLQLPLYRMMAPALGIKELDRVQLGYFNVSDKAEETKINIADFSEPLMEKANSLIEDCVRRIFQCDFAPTDGRVMYDDYEMILQTGVASRMLATDLEEGAAQ